MVPPMKTTISPRLQAGVVLLEALLAILIFSLGILALVGLQAMAVKQTTDAKYRSEAALLANEFIGQMWVSDRTATTLIANFKTGGASYNTWLTRVSNTLPGVTAHPPTVTVSATGFVTINIYWLAPSDPSGSAPHNYLTVAQIQPNVCPGDPAPLNC